MSIDIIIEVENKPGALADLTAAVSDAGVNLAAATFTGGGEKAELHILVPHAEPVRHALALTHRAVITREHEVVVVEVHGMTVTVEVVDLVVDQLILQDHLVQIVKVILVEYLMETIGPVAAVDIVNREKMV